MQRSDESEREVTLDAPTTSPDTTETAQQTTRPGGRGSGVKRRLATLFSLKVFLGSLLLAIVGMALGGSVPIVGFVGRFVGLFAVGFLVGVVASRRRYLEVAAAGGVASGVGFLLSTLGATFLPVAADLLARYGVAIAGGGAVAGVVVAVLGHYFGRDLRDGLTRDV